MLVKCYSITGQKTFFLMRDFSVQVPEGFEKGVHMTRAEVEQNIRLMAALKMFELGKLSSGKAAQLAGLSRVEFLETCGRYQVGVFNYAPNEVVEEIEKDLDTLRQVLPE